MVSQGQIAEIVEGYGIRATPEGLFEIDSGRLMAFIPRGDIQDVSLQSGPIAPRPLVQAILASFLIVVGLSPIPFLLHWATHGGTMILETPWLLAFAVLGAWMLVQALRRGLYISVETVKGTRKLAFTGRVDAQAAKALADQIRNRFGYRGVDGVE